MKKKNSPPSQDRKPAALHARAQKRPTRSAGKEMSAVVDAAALLSDLRTLIHSARQRIATVAHSTQALLCWYVGRRLLNESLQGGRAAYGKLILVTVALREMHPQADQHQRLTSTAASCGHSGRTQSIEAAI